MPPRVPRNYERNVFINCPFDEQYKDLFNAIVFTVQIAGFIPRCARESSNAGEIRLNKIMTIISECKYGVHDLSRTELNENGLPRFNMPLELGIDLGCKRFGSKLQKQKKLLVMDTDQFRYQQFISDIAGQDIEPHSGSSRSVIRNVRNWLSIESGDTSIPGGTHMSIKHRHFQADLLFLCQIYQREVEELTFGDFTHLCRIWLEENA
jgi:hypothetical protein